MTTAQLETKAGAKAFVATLSEQARKMMLLSLAETVCEEDDLPPIVPPELTVEEIGEIKAAIASKDKGIDAFELIRRYADGSLVKN
jgi:hypothetical protein